VSKHQFKKFERSRTAPRFRLGENDLAILKELGRLPIFGHEADHRAAPQHHGADFALKIAAAIPRWICGAAYRPSRVL